MVVTTQNSSPINEPEPRLIVKRLYSLAGNVARSRGYSFTPDCDHNLQLLLEASAGKLAANDEASIQQAEQNLVTLIGEMIKELPPGDYQLHEWTLSGALSRICPLFPFC